SSNSTTLGTRRTRRTRGGRDSSSRRTRQSRNRGVRGAGEHAILAVCWPPIRELRDGPSLSAKSRRQETKNGPGRSRRQADLSPASESPRAHGLRAWDHGFFILPQTVGEMTCFVSFRGSLLCY